MPEFSSEKGKNILGGIAVVALTAIVIVSILRDKIVNEPYNSITVIGRGVVQYEPDTALIYAAVNYNNEKTSGSIQEKYNALFKKVSEKLATLEDAEVEIYPSGSSLNPNYEYSMDYSGNPPAVTGYSANYQVMLKVKNITTHKTSVDRTLALINAEGLNQITSVTYTLSDMDAIRSQAWSKAYDALEKNKAMIEQKTNSELNDIVSWYENIPSTGDMIQPPGYYGYGTPTYLPREYVLEINAGYRAEDKD